MTDRDERPFEGGAQPVRERPPEAATRARVWVGAVVVIIAIAVLVAAALWPLVFVPT